MKKLMIIIIPLKFLYSRLYENFRQVMDKEENAVWNWGPRPPSHLWRTMVN